MIFKLLTYSIKFFILFFIILFFKWQLILLSNILKYSRSSENLDKYMIMCPQQSLEVALGRAKGTSKQAVKQSYSQHCRPDEVSCQRTSLESWTPAWKVQPSADASIPRQTQQVRVIRSMFRALLSEPIVSSGTTRNTINQSRHQILSDLTTLSSIQTRRRSQYKRPHLPPQTVSHTLLTLTIHSQFSFSR